MTYFPQQNTLEFELRLQQYIEMVRTRSQTKLFEATLHAKKYLTPHIETHWEEVNKAAGLLAFEPDTDVEPYQVRHYPLPSKLHRNSS